jgi:hypothetical protein
VSSDRELLYKIIEGIEAIRNTLESKNQTSSSEVPHHHHETVHENDFNNAYPFDRRGMLCDTKSFEGLLAWNEERNRYYKFMQREREKILKEKQNPVYQTPEWMSVQIPSKRLREIKILAQMKPDEYKIHKREQDLIEREKKKIYKESMKKKKSTFYA